MLYYHFYLALVDISLVRSKGKKKSENWIQHKMEFQTGIHLSELDAWKKKTPNPNGKVTISPHFKY